MHPCNIIWHRWSHKPLTLIKALSRSWASAWAYQFWKLGDQIYQGYPLLFNFRILHDHVIESPFQTHSRIFRFVSLFTISFPCWTRSPWHFTLFTALTRASWLYWHSYLAGPSLHPPPLRSPWDWASSSRFIEPSFSASTQNQKNKILLLCLCLARNHQLFQKWTCRTLQRIREF